MKNVCKILAVLMLLTLFIGCSQETPEEFDMDFSKTEGNSFDLEGIELLYRSNLDSGNGAIDLSENYLGYVMDTEFSDLAMQRVRELEDTYNFTLNVTTDKADIVSMTAGGLNFADIFLSPSFNFFSWSKAGVLTGISKLSDYIDYKDSKKWGSPLLLESMFYKDDVFGLTPNAWPEQNFTSFGYPLVANVDLITENGASDPRELVDEGLWTWDRFTEELEKNTVREGNEVRCYGLCGGNSAYMIQMLMHSNGIHLVERNDNGELICGYFDDRAIKAFEMSREISIGKYKHTYVPDLSSSEAIIESFINEEGTYAFLPTHFIFGVYGAVSMNLDNFAILPTPMGPDVDSYIYSSVHHTMYYAISFPTTGNSEAAAFVANKIYEPLPGYETHEDIKEYMSRNFFFDERDADVFFKLLENSHYNYDYTTGFDIRRIPENINNATKTVAAILEEQSSVVEQCFTEYVEVALSAYDVLFGK